MKERITKEQSSSADIESVLGNFTLHIPRDLKPPEELPALLSAREYGHDDIPLLQQAELKMLPGDNPWEATIVGTIDFDTPSECKIIRSFISTNIEKKLLLLLAAAKDKPQGRELSYTASGIQLKDPSSPTAVIRVSKPDVVTSQLEIKATVERARHYRSAYNQLIDIQSVAEQWVELQDWVTKISQIPYTADRTRHIYLDMDNDVRVSELEFALAETMASYGVESVPRWSNDINSRELARYGDPVMDAAPAHARHTMPHDLIVEIRKFAEMTDSDMQTLDQGVIINALGRFIRNHKR